MWTVNHPDTRVDIPDYYRDLGTCSGMMKWDKEIVRNARRSPGSINRVLTGRDGYWHASDTDQDELWP